MGWIAIHGYDRNTYCPALALYKVQFKKIRNISIMKLRGISSLTASLSFSVNPTFLDSINTTSQGPEVFAVIR
jgi:hypothetical protein